MSPIAHPGPPQRRRPSNDGSELFVHPQRVSRGISAAERRLVCVFLKRYVVWCAKARRVERVRNAVELLAEVVRGSAPGAGGDRSRQDC
ncbi:MAG TPA: hypothetical protein VJV77_09420 [Casimicrobiaceae bacterium]|nr:hypothetical protein [Casimicrobiaceae bacterium]